MPDRHCPFFVVVSGILIVGSGRFHWSSFRRVVVCGSSSSEFKIGDKGERRREDGVLAGFVRLVTPTMSPGLTATKNVRKTHQGVKDFVTQHLPSTGSLQTFPPTEPVRSSRREGRESSSPVVEGSLAFLTTRTPRGATGSTHLVARRVYPRPGFSGPVLQHPLPERTRALEKRSWSFTVKNPCVLGSFHGSYGTYSKRRTILCPRSIGERQ